MRQKALFYNGFTVLVNLPMTVNNMTSIKFFIFLPFLSFKVLKKSDTHILMYRSFLLIFYGFYDDL